MEQVVQAVHVQVLEEHLRVPELTVQNLLPHHLLPQEVHQALLITVVEGVAAVIIIQAQAVARHLHLLLHPIVVAAAGHLPAVPVLIPVEVEAAGVLPEVEVIAAEVAVEDVLPADKRT